MSVRARLFIIACSGAAALASGSFQQAVAQTVIPPGVPEPGLVIWGTAVNQTNTAQAITITSASWSVTDGTKTAVYSAASRPPTRIVNANGQSYYILQVPFDTRQIGTVTLADPATVGINSFELKAATPPTYTLAPTINGVLASVRSIDGAPASGGTVPVAGFTSATRGRVIRIDLAIIPPGNDYDTWAAGFFGSAGLPQAARTADPDDDGLTNEQEFAAGTDPTKDTSVLMVTLTLQAEPLLGTLTWQSASSRSYVIEFASDPAGPWNGLGPAVPSAGAETQAAITLPAGVTNRFYRVRLAP